MTSPFPDSRPLTDLIAEGSPEPAYAYRVSGPPGTEVHFTAIALSDVVVLARMPDGSCWYGRGATSDIAMADARRAWVRWKRGHAGRLAVDGHAYRRRCRARTRRHAR